MEKVSFSKTESAKLYLVATPIGNLEDITFRAVRILKEVPYLFSEDTRHSRILLDHYGIKKPLESYFEHNKSLKQTKILKLLKSGFDVAIITDAGTPGISDPGFEISKAAIKAGIPVTLIPGPVALISAIIPSGLPVDKFSFLGFLPRTKSEQKALLEKYQIREDTLIIYEAPNRINNTLTTIYEVFGERDLVLARELTKKFEEFSRGKLSEFLKNPIEARGEFVILVSGANSNETLTKLTIVEHVAFYLRLGYDEKMAMKLTAKDRKVPKSEIYKVFKLGG